jgi:hypothetical protein
MACQIGLSRGLGLLGPNPVGLWFGLGLLGPKPKLDSDSLALRSDSGLDPDLVCFLDATAVVHRGGACCGPGLGLAAPRASRLWLADCNPSARGFFFGEASRLVGETKNLQRARPSRALCVGGTRARRCGAAGLMRWCSSSGGSRSGGESVFFCLHHLRSSAAAKKSRRLKEVRLANPRSSQ